MEAADMSDVVSVVTSKSIRQRAVIGYEDLKANKTGKAGNKKARLPGNKVEPSARCDRGKENNEVIDQAKRVISSLSSKISHLEPIHFRASSKKERKEAEMTFSEQKESLVGNMNI